MDYLDEGPGGGEGAGEEGEVRLGVGQAGHDAGLDVHYEEGCFGHCGRWADDFIGALFAQWDGEVEGRRGLSVD